MPNCFQLTRKGETEPTKLQDIDIELCKMLGREVDKKYWVANWYNTIGLMLAVGKSWQEMRGIFEEVDTLLCIDYLEEHFSPDAWYERR